jgi:hypothetical protein
VLHHVNQLDPASGLAREVDGDLSRRLTAWGEIRGAYDLHGCLEVFATGVPARKPLELPRDHAFSASGLSREPLRRRICSSNRQLG